MGIFHVLETNSLTITGETTAVIYATNLSVLWSAFCRNNDVVAQISTRVLFSSVETPVKHLLSFPSTQGSHIDGLDYSQSTSSGSACFCPISHRHDAFRNNTHHHIKENKILTLKKKKT